MSSGCTQPVIAENELNGANTGRRRGRRPTRSTGATSSISCRRWPRAAPARCCSSRARRTRAARRGDWWRQVSTVRRHRARVYFAAPRIAKQGPVDGQPDDAQHASAKRVAEFTCDRHPAEQARPDARLPDDARLGRPRGRRRAAWLEVTSSGARRQQVASEARPALGLVVGLGRLERRRADPDKPRGLRLPLGPRPEPLRRAGGGRPGFNASLTEGQLVLPPGARCTLYGKPITESAICGADTGDRRRGRRLQRRLRPARGERSRPRSRRKQLADAERAVVTSRFGGSFAALPRGAREGAREPAVRRAA